MKDAQRLEVTVDHSRGELRPVHAISYWTIQGIWHRPHPIDHLVPTERLNKQYFRRWLYWHGISRAMLYRQGGFDMEEPELEYPPHAGERQAV